jgi:membrane fusion protein, adhesin transport system
VLKSPLERTFLRAQCYARVLMPMMQARLLLWVSVVFILVFFLWARYAVLDEVTHAEGKVIPSSHMQIVQNLEGGILKELFVKVGDEVKAGSLLLRLNDMHFHAQRREIEIHAAALEAKLSRLQAQMQDRPLYFTETLKTSFPAVAAAEEQLYKTQQQNFHTQLGVLSTQQRQHEQELKEIEARTVHLEKRLELQRQEFVMTEKLLKEQVASEIEMLHQRRALADLLADKEAALLAKPRIKHAVEGVMARRAEIVSTFKNNAQTDLTQAEQEQAKVLESLRTASDRLERTAVRAPLPGLVNAVYVTTLGGIVQPGQPLVEIVPTHTQLLIEAKVRPQDIGFIHEGQKAIVKISAYDFSVYGGVPGIITQISPSTQAVEKTEKGEAFYVVTIETNDHMLRARGLDLPILSGMNVNVDILTGHKTVLDYLLKPILKTKHAAFGER